MDVQKILNMTDHTLLRVGCTKEEIAALCEEAVKYRCAAVCIPPCYTAYARECIAGRGVKVGGTIGFPNGYHTARIKEAETREAVELGAQEIDMVLNLSHVKNRDWDAARDEITRVRKACEGITLKVIIETCYLTDEEKITLCQIVSECGVDFIKTSTGFGPSGATVHDVALMKEHVGCGVKVKAAGGIHTLEEAQALIDAGASRIGASSIVKAAKESGFVPEG